MISTRLSICTFSPVTTQFKSQSRSVTLPLESGQKQIVRVFFLEKSFSWFCSNEVRTPGFFRLELCKNGFQQILVMALNNQCEQAILDEGPDFMGCQEHKDLEYAFVVLQCIQDSNYFFVVLAAIAMFLMCSFRQSPNLIL